MGLYGNKILNINETVFYKGDGISIHVNISDKFNYGDQAYFKVYDNENYAKATKVARIQVKDTTPNATDGAYSFTYFTAVCVYTIVVSFLRSSSV